MTQWPEPLLVHVGCPGDGCPRCVTNRMDAGKVRKERSPICRVPGCKQLRRYDTGAYCFRHYSDGKHTMMHGKCKHCGGALLVKGKEFCDRDCVAAYWRASPINPSTGKLRLKQPNKATAPHRVWCGYCREPIRTAHPGKRYCGVACSKRAKVRRQTAQKSARRAAAREAKR